MKKSSWKEGEDWFERVLNIHTPLSATVTSIFYFSLFNWVAKNQSLGRKILERNSPPPPPRTYACDWESSTAGDYDLLARDTVCIGWANLSTNLEATTSRRCNNLDNVTLGSVLMKEGSKE
jgi:hypothetical protein